MKKLIIINAGKFGREVYSWAKQSNEFGKDWIIKGFLDSRKNMLDDFNYDTEIISSPEQYVPEKDDLFVCGIGDVKQKKFYSEMMLSKGAEFVNIIHPTVVMGENVKIGKGIILCPYSVVSCDATIGDFVSVNFHSIVGHDVTIGKWSVIDSNSVLNGNVVIEEGVHVASNAVLLPSARAGRYSTIGAGSVLLKNVNAEEVVFGVPAKPLMLPRPNKQ